MTFDNIDLVKLNLDDIKELRDICHQTFSDTYSNENTVENMQAYLDASFNEENLKKELNEPDSEYYFAKTNDKTLGYFKINYRDAQTDLKERDGMELERIYVLKEFQGFKVGYSMLNKAIDLAKKKRMKYVWLGAWEKNTKAFKFYKKNGFTVAGSHSFKIGNDLQTDHIMKLFLTEN